ncbi:hypothetical protein AB0L14_37030, partial [Streptomyces sp. NPDC052727]|uniref:hypothetical protein n=1 Tax=Streptomyces sp. NPDC052727 TaxID=3154854 RepID=UPI003431C392
CRFRNPHRTQKALTCSSTQHACHQRPGTAHLEQGDEAAAEQYKWLGISHLLETQHPNTGKLKRIVPDAEAARLRAAEDERKQAEQDAEHLAVLKKKLGITPRTNGSAYRPYRGGLPTLGKDR